MEPADPIDGIGQLFTVRTALEGRPVR